MPRAVEVVDDAPQYGGREAFLLGAMAEQRERAPGLGVDALVREQWCCLAGQDLDLGHPAHGSVHLGQLDGEQDTSPNLRTRVLRHASCHHCPCSW